MSKDKLTDYDATASNNTDVGGISVAEGMLPSGVNNAIREQMSHLADFASGTSGVDVLKLQDDTDTNSIKLQAPASVTADTTFTMPDGDGSADQVLKTDGAGQLGWADRHANPSLIINGAMQVAQRGTSVTGVGNANTFLVDRFRAKTTSGSIDLSQSTTAPAGFTSSFKIAVNTTNAFGTASDEAYFEQVVEAQNLQHLQYGLSTAQKITLSFWVRSSVTGTYGVWFYQDDATKDYEVSYTIDAADTWEKKSVTIDGNTADVIDNNNESGMRVRWYLDGGSDRRGTISSSWATSNSTSPRLPTGAPAWMNGSNDWYITGVKLEVGPTATDFVHRSYGEELALCQRYYEEIGNRFIWSGNTTSGTAYYNSAPFTVNKRAVPTITLTNSDNSGFPATASSIAGGAATVSAVRMARSSNATTNGGYYSDNITADAEL